MYYHFYPCHLFSIYIVSTERQRDRESERQRDTESETERDRERDIERETEIDSVELLSDITRKGYLVRQVTILYHTKSYRDTTYLNRRKNIYLHLVCNIISALSLIFQ